jgi:DNA ligase (NAD+)
MNIIDRINQSPIIYSILYELSVKELEKAILLCSESYHNSGISLVSDSTYDILVDRLKQLKPNSDVLKNVGAPVVGSKVELPYWMGSMDKIKTEEKMIDRWTRKFYGPYIISDKLDGISCLFRLFDGEVKLYTRGNGIYGKDITFLLNYVSFPLESIRKKKFEIAVRGELIMSKKNFRKFQDEMSNARNMVAGLVNSKEKTLDKNHIQYVDFVAYELIEPKKKPSEQMIFLEENNFNVVDYKIYSEINLEFLDEIYQSRKERSIYEIDGLIVTDDHKHPRNVSGNPEYSFAYKGMTPTAKVKVLKVLWNPSKDGVLVPRIHFTKVRLSQADLEYTTGFNAKFISDNGIGPGAVITIIRSGEVIPYVLDVVKSVEPEFPDDYEYKWDKNGVNIILKNISDNRDVIINRLTKFMKNIGVDNLSKGIVTRLVDNGYDDIFSMIQLTVDDLLKIEGFQKKLANKLYSHLNSALQRLDILTLMDASNIFGRGFGKKKIRKILNDYPTIVNDYSKRNYSEWYNNLIEIEGFNSITAESFLSSLPEFQKFYRKISKIISILPYKNITKSKGLFRNQNVVFTGFRNQKWQMFIEAEGGKVTTSVSKNTTILIYKDGDESSSKYQKAKQLGIKLISMSNFAKMYKV